MAAANAPKRATAQSECPARGAQIDMCHCYHSVKDSEKLQALPCAAALAGECATYFKRCEKKLSSGALQTIFLFLSIHRTSEPRASLDVQKSVGDAPAAAAQRSGQRWPAAEGFGSRAAAGAQRRGGGNALLPCLLHRGDKDDAARAGLLPHLWPKAAFTGEAVLKTLCSGERPGPHDPKAAATGGGVVLKKKCVVPSSQAPMMTQAVGRSSQTLGHMRCCCSRTLVTSVSPGMTGLEKRATQSWRPR